MQKVKEERSKLKEGEVLVGKKPIIVYINAVMTQFNSGQDEVAIRARGMNNGKAIDVSQAVIRFMEKVCKVECKDINLGSEEGEGSEEGKKVRFSRIDIIMAKTKTGG